MNPVDLSLQTNFYNWSLSLSPIVVITFLMLGLGWGGKKAGPAGLLCSILIAFFQFGVNFEVLLVSLFRGVLLSVKVLYIIIPALLLYHVADEAGGIKNIGNSVSKMTSNKVLQLMILGFGFSTFLQGVAGFGVPVAVVAPLLVGIGFSPVQAVAAALVGHAWSVSLGDIASSYQALLSVTDLPPHELSVYIGFLLSIAGIIAALSVAHMHDGWYSIKKYPGIVLGLGISTSLVHFLLAWIDLTVVATFGAGMFCLGMGFWITKFYRKNDTSSSKTKSQSSQLEEKKEMGFHLAFSPYYILILVVASVEFVPFIHDFLGKVAFQIEFPKMTTAYGIVTEAKPWKLKILTHAGGMLILTTVVGWSIYKFSGRWPENSNVFKRTYKSAYPTTIGIITMVAMASVKMTGGMLQVLAEGATAVSGNFYPFFAPMVGLLGCFITGSNTNSNILFGSFQVKAATLIAKSEVIIGASQSAGGSLGSMIAPAKVLVGCSTAGLGGNEGEVFRKVAPYTIISIIVIGLLTLWLVN